LDVQPADRRTVVRSTVLVVVVLQRQADQRSQRVRELLRQFGRLTALCPGWWSEQEN
jgi:hypothetical protein